MATLQQERDFFASMFGDESPCTELQDVSTKEMDEAIEECKEMLEYSIDRRDKNEISYWRKLLQENKVCRRKMLNA